MEQSTNTSESHHLPRKPLNTEELIMRGWKVEEINPRTGGILDAGKIITKDYLQSGESYISGEERLLRIKASEADSKLQLDAADYQALHEEKGQVTLRWLHKTKGITYLSFWNTILHPPGEPRYVFSLIQVVGGSWYGKLTWVDDEFWISCLPAGLLESLPTQEVV